jgi:beta-galactosidase
MIIPLLFAQFIPVAVWYGGGTARAPMLEPAPLAKKEVWRKDLQQIRALGFNSIRCWIDWSSGEPTEGKYNFETLEVLTDLAQQEGLKVFVQVYMDSAPLWLGRKYPDSLFVSSNGMAIHPESSPGYCRDHPGVRARDVAFYQALAQHMKTKPAFAGWDLWSEPHVINWANPTYIPNPEFCFCPNTVRRYRTWLEKKYSNLDNLNQAWYRRFATWDEVEPNRLSTILSYTDYIDWKTFIADKLGEDLHERYQAVKTVLPALPATSHAAGVGLFSSPHYWEGQSDDWTMAAQVDYYGTSFYPKHSAFVDRDPVWRGALLDFTRSFGFAQGRNGFYIGELQAGFGTIAVNVSPTVTPADLRLWAWSVLARGARAVNFYAWYPMSTGYESGGFGMINLDGTITERAKEAGRVAQVVDKNQKLFQDARPPRAEVAIIYNPLAHFVGGRQRAAAYGGPQGEVAGIERDSLLGAYKALWPTHVPVDFVHINHLDNLAQYKLVYLPYPLMLPSASIPSLRGYVEQGGHLVVEARPGWNNETGRASAIIPGMGLHEILGCRETAIETAAPGKTILRWENGDEFPGRWFQETLEPLRSDARIVARFANGQAAAVQAQFGKGHTLTIGSFVAANAPEKLFTHLMSWAGVSLGAPVTGAVEVRWLVSGGRPLIFVFNHTAERVEAQLVAPASDVLTGAPLAAGALPVEPFSVRILH